MQQLLPPGDSGEVDLDEIYAYPSRQTWVRANMVASADGAATAAGRSGGLSGEADKRVFGVLRALADVVLVGAGTARTEGYGPVDVRPSYAARRASARQLPAAAMAVVTARLDLDLDGPLLGANGAAPTYVVTTSDAPADRLAEVRRWAEVLVAGRDRVDLGAAVDALVERGLRRVLCEGGPRLLAQLVAAHRLDELCLTVSPLLLAGDAPRILTGPLLDPPVRLRLASLLEEDGYLFTRYAVG